MKRKTLEKLVNHAAGDKTDALRREVDDAIDSGKIAGCYRPAPKLTTAQHAALVKVWRGGQPGSITNLTARSLEKKALLKWKGGMVQRPNGEGSYYRGKWAFTGAGKALAATFWECK